MESDKLKSPKLIVLTASVIGCFWGMFLIYPFCYLLGIDINQHINSVELLILFMFALITFTLFGYYSSCYLAAYILVWLKIINKSQISELDIGGKKLK